MAVMTDMTFRRTTAYDLVAVYELGLRCYDVTAIPYNYWSIENIAGYLETGVSLVAERDGQIVGFLLGEESFEGDEQTAYLEWLAVDAEHRRQGLGRRLTEAALVRVRELGKARVVVDIAAPNAASRALAEGLGFEEEVSVSYFAKRLS
jgi:[ribosomal protein S18]-alanine N-acetyltransferase